MQTENERVISIVIPSYNGKGLLARYLPGVIKAIENHRGEGEILVIDDGSDDNTWDFLDENFPNVNKTRLETNTGFSNACNYGVKKASGEIVILLNNDIRVDKNFITPLIKHFNDDMVFAVESTSLIMKEGHGIVAESPSRGVLEKGLFRLFQPGIDGIEVDEGVCTTFHASCGFSAFDKDKFLEIGGMDPIFYPFYWEDIDLSYRAWQRGWKVLHEPDSIVFHESHATIRGFKSIIDIDRVYMKNAFLFMWKNLESEWYYEHLRYIIQNLKSPIKGEKKILRLAFFDAFREIRRVFQMRNKKDLDRKIGMNEILMRSSNIRVEGEYDG